jgi:hypothetical protein
MAGGAGEPARSAAARPARKPGSTAKPKVAKSIGLGGGEHEGSSSKTGYRDGSLTIQSRPEEPGRAPRTVARQARRAARGQQVKAKRMRPG